LTTLSGRDAAKSVKGPDSRIGHLPGSDILSPTELVEAILDGQVKPGRWQHILTVTVNLNSGSKKLSLSV
jgi:hypothetical protein